MDIANSTSSAFPAVSAAGTDLRHAQVMHRSAFIDNLRWSIILFVISMHAADTYWPFGNWYFADKASTGWSTALLFGTYQSFLQAFFMGLLVCSIRLFRSRSNALFAFLSANAFAVFIFHPPIPLTRSTAVAYDVRVWAQSGPNS